MSAGCPVICPDLPSLIDEYLGDDSDAYPPGRHDQAVARALTYVQQPHRRSERSRTLIERSAQFDWARLRPRFADTYRTIIGHADHRSPAPTA